MCKKYKFILKLPFEAEIDSEYDIDGVVVWPSYSQGDPATLRGVFNSYEEALEYAKNFEVYEALYSLDGGESYQSTFDRTPEEDEHPGYFFSYSDAEEWVNTYIGSTDEDDYYFDEEYDEDDEEECEQPVLFEVEEIKILAIEIVEVDDDCE